MWGRRKTFLCDGLGLKTARECCVLFVHMGKAWAAPGNKTDNKVCVGRAAGKLFLREAGTDSNTGVRS